MKKIIPFLLIALVACNSKQKSIDLLLQKQSELQSLEEKHRELDLMISNISQGPVHAITIDKKTGLPDSASMAYAGKKDNDVPKEYTDSLFVIEGKISYCKKQIDSLEAATR